MIPEAVNWRELPPELIAGLAGLVASFLVLPLTEIAKKLGKTSGPSTTAIAGLLSFLFGGLVGYASGLYGTGWDGLLNGLIATTVAWLRAEGQWRVLRSTSASGVEKVIREVASE